MKSNGKKKKITIDKLLEEPTNTLKERLLEKFPDHILAITKIRTEDLKKEEILVVINDSDSNKLPKQELQEKIDITLSELVKNDKTICTAILTSTIIKDCKDSTYLSLQTLINSEIIYDTGIIEALRAMWQHKELVLKKLEKYAVAYVMAGSIVKGIANPKSDMDSYIIIDDTDVKKMGKFELQDKLRSIVHNLGLDVESQLKVKRKIHTQVWLLTDYWDNLKDANPVMVTMLRDCIPIFDRGIFMAWKNLLDSGRIKPSAEAIDMYFNSGEQMYNRANSKLLEIVMEDLCLGLLYPSQALVMLAGEQPPTPKEAVDKMKSLFIEKYKIFEEKDLDVLAQVIQMRKSIEYGEIKQIDGMHLKTMLDEGKIYLEKIKDAFKIVEEKNKQKI